MAGFRIVHGIYSELVSLGYQLNDLYDYSVKELLFMLKYKREGLAYKIWRQSSMNRAAFSPKRYPEKVKEALPELFEKQTVPMPDWLKEDYEQKVNDACRKER